ncbi:hypothetical protein [Serratia sp. 2723]
MAESVSRKGRQEQANFMHVNDLGGLEVLQISRKTAPYIPALKVGVLRRT